MKVLHPWKDKELVTATAFKTDNRTADGTWYRLTRNAASSAIELDLAELRITDLTAPGEVVLLLAPALDYRTLRFSPAQRDRATGLLARAEHAMSENCGVIVTPDDFAALGLRALIELEEFDAAIMASGLGFPRGDLLCVFGSPVDTQTRA